VKTEHGTLLLLLSIWHMCAQISSTPMHVSPKVDPVCRAVDSPASLTFVSSYIQLHLQPVVLFAGEHTHSSFYSTVHGAYLTGRSAAQVLLSPQSPQELVMECQGTSDLSSWIQGISLD
jgi:hypothetical protein